MDKKKCADPSIKECSNCGTSGAKLTCGVLQQSLPDRDDSTRRMATRKLASLPKRGDSILRSPTPQLQQISKEWRGATLARFVWNVCPMRLHACTLPCNDEFHQGCVEALRKPGALQTCPLCRADLPDGSINYLKKPLEFLSRSPVSFRK